MSFLSRHIDRQIAAYQRELVETHYQEVETMYRQMRGWRHDYRSHIQAMKALAADGDVEAIKDYLDQLDTELNTVDTVVKTGDPMADAILNSKISLARARHIGVTADACIPVKLSMSGLDLCIILGNLFDNAIEASMKLPESQRLIRIYMDMKNTQLYISFTNFTAEKKMVRRGKVFETTKGAGHGLGLARMDAIIERLDGYVSRNSEDGAFTTEILIPQV
ncbi:MAG: sensor histidine kinase [Hungatella sp.]|jgi:sensor histidine kinase regulating citrate/malate metabolism|nr:sensor histidine kinase [Hungatella sp.]